MQPNLLSNLSVQCDNITSIVPPIVFDCVVNGKKLKASITHQEDNKLQFIYHISFSDGHKASFVAPMEGGRWQDEATASPYASAIADDLNAFCGFRPSKPPFCIRLKNDKEAFNVWVVPHASKKNYHTVYYKGDYRFDLRKQVRWEVNSVRENSFINEEIAAIVCKNIEERLLQPLLF